MKNLTLLCVEDDVEIQEDIKYLFDSYFNTIYTALDGQEALNIYNKYNPNIILLDINIPKIDGLEVAKKIRETDKNTPIIF